jgi:hypothetical protein
VKKILLILVVILAFSSVFAAQISLVGGMELSGKSRNFVGLKVSFLDDLLGLSIDVYSPVSSFESSADELQNVELIEIDPYILLNLKLDSLKMYAGVAPIIIADIKTYDVGLFSTSLFHAKVGLSYGKGIVFSVDGITTLSTQFKSTGIYSVSAGIGLGF